MAEHFWKCGRGANQKTRTCGRPHPLLLSLTVSGLGQALGAHRAGSARQLVHSACEGLSNHCYAREPSSGHLSLCCKDSQGWTPAKAALAFPAEPKLTGLWGWSVVRSDANSSIAKAPLLYLKSSLCGERRVSRIVSQMS